jgi:hypothetical protein
MMQDLDCLNNLDWESLYCQDMMKAWHLDHSLSLKWSSNQLTGLIDAASIHLSTNNFGRAFQPIHVHR